MMWLVPWILLIICLVALTISLRYNYIFARIIIKVEDSVTESLDILDVHHNNISKVLEIPIFFDSPQVRQVVQSIKACRDSILYIANNIASVEEEKSEDS